MLEKEKNKTRAVVLAQDMCRLDYSFTYLNGKIVIYASQKDLSTLISRLTGLVGGFKYCSTNGEHYFEIADTNGERIYVEDPEKANICASGAYLA